MVTGSIHIRVDHSDLLCNVYINQILVASLTESSQVPIEFQDLKVVDLMIEMQGKTFEHTKLNNQAAIISDHCVHIDRIIIDNIDVTKPLLANSRYSFDKVDTRFYGTMGRNGQVSINIQTAFWPWLYQML